MPVRPLRILLIDDEKDSLLIARGLFDQIRDAVYDLEWVDNHQAGLEALHHGGYDACLLDYRLGASNGLDLLRRAVAEGCRTPIVMQTGQGDREVDLQAMKAGAADFLSKDTLTSALLERTLRYAIERHRAEEQRLRNEAHLRLVTQHLPAALWTTDHELRFTSSLGGGLLGAGLQPDELVGRTLFHHFQTQDHGHPVIAGHLKTLRGESAHLEREWRHRTYHVRLEPLCPGNGHVAGAIGIALDITERRQIDMGMRAAQEIQQRLLPQIAPAPAGFDIAGICRPAEATGGDFFDYVPMGDGSLGIVVADVSSHGFAPALIMAETRRVLRTLAERSEDLTAMLGAANRAVVEDTSSDLFVTLFFAQVNPITCSLIYAGAGHEGYLLAPGTPPRKLASTSMALGVVEGIEFSCEGPIPLQPGQMLVMLTDGFTEAISPDGRQFGIERTLNLIQAHQERSAAEVLDILYQTVRDFCFPEQHQDDITGVIVKVKASA